MKNLPYLRALSELGHQVEPNLSWGLAEDHYWPVDNELMDPLTTLLIDTLNQPEQPWPAPA